MHKTKKIATINIYQKIVCFYVDTRYITRAFH